jgi:hypothetical protein
MESAADRLAVSEKTRAGKEPVPVVNVAAYEWKSLGPGVRQIACCVHETLGEPNAAERCFYGLLAPEEVDTARNWEEQLPDRTAEHVKRLTQEREEEVSGFVEGEIDAIDEVVSIGEDKPTDVRDEGCNQETLREHERRIGELGYEP